MFIFLIDFSLITIAAVTTTSKIFYDISTIWPGMLLDLHIVSWFHAIKDGIPPDGTPIQIVKSADLKTILITYISATVLIIFLFAEDTASLENIEFKK